MHSWHNERSKFQEEFLDEVDPQLLQHMHLMQTQIFFFLDGFDG